MTVKLKINQIRVFFNQYKNKHLQEIKIEKDETINYRVINNMSDNNKIQINNKVKDNSLANKSKIKTIKMMMIVIVFIF